MRNQRYQFRIGPVRLFVDAASKADAVRQANTSLHRLEDELNAPGNFIRVEVSPRLIGRKLRASDIVSEE